MTENKPFAKQNLFKEEFFYLLLTIYFYVSDLVFVFRKVSGLLNSDSSAEMILAAHLNKMGGFLSKDWFYSSELRVLNTQIIFKLALRIFPNNWHYARTFSVAIFLLLLIAAGWYFMWAAGVKKKGLLFSAILICPIGQWYAWNVIYNSFYVPHIVISLVSIALLLHALKSKKKVVFIVLTVLLMCLSFMAGLGGVRQVLVCYAPMFIASVVLFFLGDYNKEKWKILLLSFGSALFGGLGYLVNANVLAKVYAFKDYNETIWQEFTLPVIFTAFEQLLRQFGWEPYTKVFSFSGVTNFIAIALVIAMVTGFIACFKRFKNMQDGEKAVYAYSLSAFVFLLIVYAETWVYNESYWLPIVPFLILPLLFVLKEEVLKQKAAVFLIILALGLIMCSISSKKNYHIVGVSSDEPIRNVATWLGEQDEYTNGIASFWNAPIVTEITNGKIEMWTIENYDNFVPYEWLQEKSHMDFPEGKVFVLIPAPSVNPDDYRAQVLKDKIIYNDGEYIVYGLNNYLEYFAE